MGEATGIQWTDRTWSPWHGCAKVSEGCRNCYADKGSRRNPGVLGVWGPRGTRVVTAEASWAKVRRWDREARERGGRIRVFPSICDPFEEWAGPMVDAKGRPVRAEGEYGRHRHVAHPDGLASMNSVRVRFLRLVEETPNIDWLVLSKRARHMAEWLAWYAMQDDAPLPRNLWGGVSVEDQAAADERIPHLLGLPLSVRFLSAEPLLGPVDLLPYCAAYAGNLEDGARYVPLADPGIHWVIVGGESGKDARPMNPEWARSIRDQCRDAGVAFLFKQWGEFISRSHTDLRHDWHAKQVADGWRLPLRDRLHKNHPGWGTITRDGEWFPETTPFNGHDDDGGGEAVLYRVGVEAAGRLIDGREWNEFPNTEVARA